jgi:hypothetical protein
MHVQLLINIPLHTESVPDFKNFSDNPFNHFKIQRL